jgi:Rrf2 family protein
MRTISRKVQYSLRALYALGAVYGQGPVLIATLAEQESIPLKFLEAILLDLKRLGIVDSKKGRGGGYQLRKPPEEITLGSVIRSIDGPLAPLPCASETAYRPCETCPDVAVCGTRIVMRQIRDATAGILDKTTIADVLRLMKEQREQRAEPVLNFEI